MFFSYWKYLSLTVHFVILCTHIHLWIQLVLQVPPPINQINTFDCKNKTNFLCCTDKCTQFEASNGLWTFPSQCSMITIIKPIVTSIAIHEVSSRILLIIICDVANEKIFNFIQDWTHVILFMCYEAAEKVFTKVESFECIGDV